MSTTWQRRQTAWILCCTAGEQQLQPGVGCWLGAWEVLVHSRRACEEGRPTPPRLPADLFVSLHASPMNPETTFMSELPWAREQRQT